LCWYNSRSTFDQQPPGAGSFLRSINFFKHTTDTDDLFIVYPYSVRTTIRVYRGPACDFIFAQLPEILTQTTHLLSGPLSDYYSLQLYTSAITSLTIKTLNHFNLNLNFMRRIRLLCLAVFLAIGFSPVDAGAQSVGPSVLNTAGGTYDNPSSYHRFEWSLGELVLINTFAPPDSSVIVTQGVLQPCTDKPGNSPLTLLFDKGDYRLFPNPTTGPFEVNFFVRETGRMNLQLVDATGRVLQQRSYQYNGCCRIDLFDLTSAPNGVYMVTAELKPDRRRPGDNMKIIRRGAFRVVKISN
jgi:hypothetical protein